jgi:hypothetical protein
MTEHPPNKDHEGEGRGSAEIALPKKRENHSPKKAARLSFARCLVGISQKYDGEGLLRETKGNSRETSLNKRYLSRDLNKRAK